MVALGPCTVRMPPRPPYNVSSVFLPRQQCGCCLKACWYLFAVCKFTGSPGYDAAKNAS